MVVASVLMIFFLLLLPQLNYCSFYNNKAKIDGGAIALGPVCPFSPIHASLTLLSPF
jgi:hypothetical protein